MKKATIDMYKTAMKLYLKHFEKFASNAAEHAPEIVESLTQTLANASTNSALGILPFTRMVAADGIVLSFDVTRNDSLGSRTITVDNINVEPSDKAYLQPKYEPLKTQIQDYLTKNWEVFPGSGGGERMEYNNFTAHLTYGTATPSQQISQK